jgi:hypothetical protein
MLGRYSSSLTKCFTLFLIIFSQCAAVWKRLSGVGSGGGDGRVGWGGGYRLRDWVGEGR